MTTPDTKEFSAGANRVEAEISHIEVDAQNEDWYEVLSELRSDLPREIDKALADMSLTDEQKLRYLNALDGIQASIERKPNFEQKQDVITAFEKLKDVLRSS